MPRHLIRSFALISTSFVLLIVAIASWRRQLARNLELNDVPPPGLVDKAVVLAKTRSENVDWVHALRPEWTPYVYSASDSPEPGYVLRPSSARGREAIVYLDFIIDNYDALPNVMAFVHAGRSQWHNDVLGLETGAHLRQLRLDAVYAQGYVNLRCGHEPGCPIAVNPHNPTALDVDGHDIRAYFADVYMELFDVPPSGVPDAVGGVCCAQFAVTRDRIRRRRRRDYERMREWARRSRITDSFGVGWVFEKLWHVIFGMPPQQ